MSKRWFRHKDKKIMLYKQMERQNINKKNTQIHIILHYNKSTE